MNREINEMAERLQELRGKIEANKAFLQNYLLDPSGDNRPAEDERLRELTALAEEFEEILDIVFREPAARREIPIEELPEEPIGEEACGTESVQPAAEDVPEDEDTNITVEYKTHELGTPDGSDNIEGDWSIEGNEEICEAGDRPEEESEDAGEAKAYPEEDDDDGDEESEEEKKKEAKKKAKKEKKEKEKREKEKKKKAKKEKKEKEKKKKKEEKRKERIFVNIYH